MVKHPIFSDTESDEDGIPSAEIWHRIWNTSQKEKEEKMRSKNEEFERMYIEEKISFCISCKEPYHVYFDCPRETKNKDSLLWPSEFQTKSKVTQMIYADESSSDEELG